MLIGAETKHGTLTTAWIVVCVECDATDTLTDRLFINNRTAAITRFHTQGWYLNKAGWHCAEHDPRPTEKRPVPWITCPNCQLLIKKNQEHATPEACIAALHELDLDSSE